MNIIEAVEEITGYKVVEELRRYLEEFPFDIAGHLVDYGIVLTPEDAVGTTRELVTQGYHGRVWPAHFLVVGLIDVPCYHCVDVREAEPVVYIETLRETEVEFEALGPLAEWIEYGLRADVEYREMAAEEEGG